MPADFLYLWKYFGQLNRSRPVAAVGFLPIRWVDIQAWASLYRLRLKSWELDVITAIDDEWLDVMARKSVKAEDLQGDDDA